MASVRSTSITEARIVAVRSNTIVRSIAAGMEALSEGSACWMRFTVSMMFAPGCRKTINKTDGFPSKNPAARMFSTESSTSATSDSLIAAPL